MIEENNLVQIKSRNYISRSAILTFKVCDYKGFLTFLFEGYGLDSEKISLDLLIGTVFHRGRQHLLEHCRIHHPDGKFDDQCIDEAVEKAYETWRKELEKKEPWLHSGEQDRLAEIIYEQECLFEGLIRAWAIRRLPQILAEYDILEVEQEEVYEGFSPIVTWLGKADAMYRRKSDGKIILDSAKTASMFPEVAERNILHDMQGISEWVAANDRLERWWRDTQAIKGNVFHWFRTISDEYAFDDQVPEWFIEKIKKDEKSAVEYWEWLMNLSEPPQVYAVQYDFALKGQRRRDNPKDKMSPYNQQTFLCHPYKKDSLVTFTNLGNIGQSADEYKWKVNPGKQPKGWEKINIWEDIGIKTWVEMLATGQVQPELGDPFLIQYDEDGNIISGILHTPPLVVRTEFELAEWKISTRFYAERIFQYKDILDSFSKDWLYNDVESPTAEKIKQYEEHLWMLFPKNTLSCHSYYGKDCQYVVHCHELMSLQELEQSGYFSRRIPHHDEEKEYFIEKGFIQDE